MFCSFHWLGQETIIIYSTHNLSPKLRVIEISLSRNCVIISQKYMCFHSFIIIYGISKKDKKERNMIIKTPETCHLTDLRSKKKSARRDSNLAAPKIH